MLILYLMFIGMRFRICTLRTFFIIFFLIVGVYFQTNPYILLGTGKKDSSYLHNI